MRSRACAALLFALATAGCGGDVTESRPGSGGGSGHDAVDAAAGQDGSVPEQDGAIPDGGGGGGDAGPDADTTGCGDGKIQPGEGCDDGNSAPGDGCSAQCDTLEEGFACPKPGVACVSTVECGDSRVSGQETCDDGNLGDGDGCTIACQLEAGFTCPAPGLRCSAAKCGDGIVAAREQCDDGVDPAVGGDGCSATCTLEPGYHCPTVGAACVVTVCNDGLKQGGEPCDDGNHVVGDGCTPFCEVEPSCTASGCSSRCGDGLILPTDAEECDDGNTKNRDGCSSTCKEESGYSCTLAQGVLPATLQVPVTYRDVVALPAGGSTRHPDFEVFGGDGITFGLLQTNLDASGKPVYTGVCSASGVTTACPHNRQMTTQTAFDQWYHDDATVNVTKVTQMSLTYDAVNGWYTFTTPAGGFFPWDGDATSWVGQGKENLSGGHNFGFTSEVRYWFQYDSATTPTLSFNGDDDVWVFINRKLAVDIGGLHPPEPGSVTLDATVAGNLGLVDGHVYEIVLLHAERHSSGSNFNLTLNGFTTGKSSCVTQCGDGIVAGVEECDDGDNDGSYGSCTSVCKRGPSCGDGTRQKAKEECDDGANLTTYSAAASPGCAPGCKTSAYCGDEHVDALFGEECDDGTNGGGYGECAADCTLGPRCGDRTTHKVHGEECDDGNLVSGDGCSRDCQLEAPE